MLLFLLLIFPHACTHLEKLLGHRDAADDGAHVYHLGLVTSDHDRFLLLPLASLEQLQRLVGYFDTVHDRPVGLNSVPQLAAQQRPHHHLVARFHQRSSVHLPTRAWGISHIEITVRSKEAFDFCNLRKIFEFVNEFLPS